jgi:hypothetical protein
VAAAVVDIDRGGAADAVISVGGNRDGNDGAVGVEIEARGRDAGGVVPAVSIGGRRVRGAERALVIAVLPLVGGRGCQQAIGVAVGRVGDVSVDRADAVAADLLLADAFGRDVALVVVDDVPAVAGEIVPIVIFGEEAGQELAYRVIYQPDLGAVVFDVHGHDELD